MLTPTGINIEVLVPVFSKSKKSKYFYDSAKMDSNEIKEHLKNKDNVLIN